MKIADANIILRYLLDDNEELSEQATIILENNEDTLLELFKFKNILVSDIEVLKEAFILFAKRRLDFVDTLLYAYNKVKGHEVFTFDKKLKAICNWNT